MHSRTTIRRFALLLLGLFAITARAGVYTLSPGASVAAQMSTFPTGGTTLANTTFPFSSSGLSGSLAERVLSNDPSNPYTGGLTFTYVLTLTGSVAASGLAVSSFDSFLTDVSYNNTGGGVAPGFFSRSSEGGASGNVLQFSFLSPQVASGQSSASLVVQTNATSFTTGSASVQGAQSANSGSYAPLAIPEPATCGLLAVILIFSSLRRRRRTPLA